FKAAMDDDFNTPVAFAVLFEIAHEIQRLRDSDFAQATLLGNVLRYLGRILGLLQEDPEVFLQKSASVTLEAAQIEQLIQLRNQARTTKNWAEADRIRNELLEQSILLEDGPQGTTWRVQS